ncbi:MAG: hypothetical protein MIO87_00715 [Methanomassiliicoccales archaeon]|nr:hypothetical protein [Methanomassiliicoccales archaeon]TFG57365.1 MAG: hypothetical protein E4H30_00830 [Methanomassiliicoccus sp.]
MKWRSHLSIGNAIADRFQMSEGERRSFLDGMVEPDRHGERANRPGHSYRVRHHRASDRVIMLHVWMARKSFLRNDTYQGYRHLGMALHYIQDKSTAKGFMGLTHERREKKLAGLTVPQKAVEGGLRKYVSSPEFVRGTIVRTKPKKDLEGIMVQASFRSAAVAAAVLDASQPPLFSKQMSLARRRHALIHAPLAVGSMAVGLSLALAWYSPFPIIVPLPLVLLALILDRPYRQLKRLAEWNGLRRH